MALFGVRRPFLGVRVGAADLSRAVRPTADAVDKSLGKRVGRRGSTPVGRDLSSTSARSRAQLRRRSLEGDPLFLALVDPRAELAELIPSCRGEREGAKIEKPFEH